MLLTRGRGCVISPAGTVDKRRQSGARGLSGIEYNKPACTDVGLATKAASDLIQGQEGQGVRKSLGL
jgi:hypothetical protein